MIPRRRPIRLNRRHSGFWLRWRWQAIRGNGILPRYLKALNLGLSGGFGVFPRLRRADALRAVGPLLDGGPSDLVSWTAERGGSSGLVPWAEVFQVYDLWEDTRVLFPTLRARLCGFVFACASVAAYSR